MAIKIPYEGNEYILDYTRRSVKTMESKGFKIGEIQDKPATMLPDFFAGAFIANHRHVKKEVIEDIFNNIKRKDEIIEKLIDIYSDTLLSIVGDGEKEGNIDWEIV